MSDVQTQIKEIIEGNKIVLFMKGTPQAPQCGFSAQTMQCLTQAGAKDIAAVNILQNEAMRQGIKEYSNWPTIPQVYLNGKFIGGCDIVTEMFERGELQTAIQSALNPPS